MVIQVKVAVVEIFCRRQQAVRPSTHNSSFSGAFDGYLVWQANELSVYRLRRGAGGEQYISYIWWVLLRGYNSNRD